MPLLKKHQNRKEQVFILVFIALLAILSLVPTEFEKQIYVNSEGVKAKVISVDNQRVFDTGLIKQGDQICIVEILQGKDKGTQVEGFNMLSGKMEFDKIFSPGDMAFVLLERDKNDKIIFANLIDHYRVNLELLLIGLFAVIIIIASGYTGVRTLLSFAFALLSIWKILIPFMLRGYSPILVALVVGNVITVTTLLMVAGFTRKAYVAIVSAVSVSLLTCLLAIVFGKLFKVHGAVMQWSESLLYAGFESLDLTAIFQAGIYLACSGAILDLAIDISAALDEVEKNRPDISRRELVLSGLTIGRSVMGTQTTTLLLAYMGSYISVMMVYMAQGTPFMCIFNSKSIAAEILHTFVGCIGLVAVSPLTAVLCGMVYKRVSKNNSQNI